MDEKSSYRDPYEANFPQTCTHCGRQIEEPHQHEVKGQNGFEGFYCRSSGAAAFEERSSPDPTLCPLRVQSSLEAYVRGLPPGDFIRAVLSNDLNEAIARADDVNIHALPHIVAYVREHLPAMAWGSKANVDRWLKRTRSGVNTDGREGTINTGETERAKCACPDHDCGALTLNGSRFCDMCGETNPCRYR